MREKRRKPSYCLVTVVIKALADSSLRLRYYHLPGYSDRQAIAFLAYRLEEDDVAYVAFHGDDDFFVPATFIECARFLDNDPSYATAQGRSKAITLNQPGLFGRVHSLSDYWSAPCLQEDNRIHRLSSFYKQYYCLQFSVHRISNLVSASKYFEATPDRHWGEILHSSIFAIQGKSAFIDALYLARHIHPGINHESYSRWTSDISFSRGYIFCVQQLVDCFGLSSEEHANVLSLMQELLCSQLLRKNKQPAFQLAKSWFVPGEILELMCKLKKPYNKARYSLFPKRLETQLTPKVLASLHQVDCLFVAVIRGDTPHFDVVVSEVSKGVAAVSRDSGVPVIFGVLTTDTMQQALERAGIKSNLGWSYGLQAIEMGSLMAALPG